MGFPDLLVLFKLINLACVKIVTLTPQYPFAKFPDMNEISYSMLEEISSKKGNNALG